MKKNIEEKVIKQYLENVESKVICNDFKISSSTLGRVVKRNSIPKRKIVRPKIKPKYDYIAGKIFNNLKVLEIVRKSLYKDNTYYAICECLNCGNKNYKAKPYEIVNNKIKSCGCLRNSNQLCGNKVKSFKGYKEISGQKWSSYRLGALKRKLEFDIDIEYAWNIFTFQKKKCNLSGRELYFGKSNSKEFTASMDRIDPYRGYVKGNIQWVHKDVNKMKLKMDEDIFLRLCRSMNGDLKARSYLNGYYESLRKEKEKNGKKNNKYSRIQLCGKDNPLFKGYEEISAFYWWRIENRALKNDRTFDINIRFAWDLFKKCNEICVLSGVDICFGRTSKSFCSASLDRIDSSKGYERGNVQWVHKDVNMMKGKLEESYFVSLCRDIMGYSYGKYIIDKR